MEESNNNNNATSSEALLFMEWTQQCETATSESDRNGIFQRVQSHFQSTNTTTTTSQKSLALLIQTLQPCFTITSSQQQPHRLAGLTCLRGALSGIRTSSSNNAKTLPLSTRQLISQFLLPYIGPLDMRTSDAEEEDEDAIRDAALETLVVLLQIPIIIIDDETDKQHFLPWKWWEWIMNTAQQGVRYRSADPNICNHHHLEDSDDDDDHDEHDAWKYEENYRRGLSILPRSRRSLCFEVLAVAVRAMQNQLSTTTSSLDALLPDPVAQMIRSFVIFVAQCLHGESDPRCLIQLLQTLDDILESFPFRLLDVRFPISECFDAVAPYYPIQFTPPPNDVHHITREQLRNAVMRILSNTRYDDNTDENSSMRHLALNLILESVEPPPEDGPIPFSDQNEIIQDLDAFLFRVMDVHHPSNLERLENTQAEQIAAALERIHEKASLAVADAAPDREHAKSLADGCRHLMAKIALEVEGTSLDLWTSFVATPVRRMAERLSRNDPDGNHSSTRRVAVAYLAGLASSGGAKTSQITLKVGLDALFKALQNDENDSIAFYGIAAFFASAQVAMDKAYAIHKIRIHPHPLEPYCSEAVNRICSLIVSTDEKPVDLYAAAVRAMETVLMTSPSDALTAEQIQLILQSLKQVSVLVATPSGDMETKTYCVEEVLQACVQTLGTCLGQVMNRDNELMKDSDESTEMVLDQEPIVSFLRSELISSLLFSAKAGHTPSSTIRYDRKTLANAACFGEKAALCIVQPLVESLYAAILQSEEDSAHAIAETLSFLFRNSNGMAGLAFQELEAPATTCMELLDALAPSTLNGKNNNLESDLGMSALRIPVSSEEPEKINTIVGKAYKYVLQLRFAYDYGVGRKHFECLMRAVDHVLPPLCSADAVKLAILLPMLSAAMKAADTEDPAASDENEIQQTLALMTPDFVDFALNGDNHPIARSHAGICLLAYISKFSSRKAQECPAQNILKNKLIPSFKAILDEVNDASVSDFADCLNIMAILGSGAACRGGNSSKTADQIMLFLVDLSCTKKAKYENCHVDLTIFDSADSNFSEALSIKAASAVGIILETENGSTLWKQRLTHISVRHVVECINDIESSDEKMTKGLPLGALAVISQLVCFCDLQHILANRQKAIARLLTYGLSPVAIESAMRGNHQIIKLILASLVKMLSTCPSSFGDSIYPLVTGAMRAFVSTDGMDHDEEISCKLLAMQALEAMAQMHHVPDTLRKVKPAVVSILGAAMNDTSSTIRQAAVEVRNVWYLVD